MANKLPAEIKIKASKVSNQHKWDPSSKHLSWYGYLCFHSPNNEPYEMTFLLNPGNTDLVFAHKNAFSSRRGFTCPDKGEQSTEFMIIRREDYKLIVENTNSEFWWHKFRIDFYDTVTKKEVYWDPIIENQDGNLYYLALILKLAVAAATATVATLLAMTFF